MNGCIGLAVSIMVVAVIDWLFGSSSGISDTVGEDD